MASDDSLSSPELQLWLWQYTDEFGKRRKTRYLLTEKDARARLRDPVKVEGSLEVRKPIDGSFRPHGTQ